MGRPRGYWTQGRGPGRVVHPKMGSLGHRSRRMANVSKSGIQAMPQKRIPSSPFIPRGKIEVPLQGRPLLLRLSRLIGDASDALAFLLVRDGLKPAGWIDNPSDPMKLKAILELLQIPYKRFRKRFYYGQTPETLQRLINAEELGRPGKDGEFAIGRALGFPDSAVTFFNKKAIAQEEAEKKYPFPTAKQRLDPAYGEARRQAYAEAGKNFPQFDKSIFFIYSTDDKESRVLEESWKQHLKKDYGTKFL